MTIRHTPASPGVPAVPVREESWECDVVGQRIVKCDGGYVAEWLPGAESYGCVRPASHLEANIRLRAAALGKVATLTDATLREAPTPYVPKVGDVVLDPLDRHFLIHDESGRVLYAHPQYTLDGFDSGCSFPIDQVHVRYDRPATPAERSAAGLDAAPVAPVARPEWVKWVPLTAPGCNPYPARRVLRWDGDSPTVAGGPEYAMPAGEWEPCAPPPAAIDEASS